MKKLVPGDAAGVFAKLEYLNRCGSVKDRAAAESSSTPEKEGRLKPGRHHRRRPLPANPASAWLSLVFNAVIRLRFSFPNVSPRKVEICVLWAPR